ncbi:PaaI family thioesterase [Sphingomonas jatrophae]|uniref:Acyl-coenzyme A thioesterase PaaI, contains HGG motif n=1 Tax=Sphingomonas jatrophae TaxID=1166337 RepID=A0A1I6LE09_9SPHN|nr:PaaI family thioesterase [Sphingomonas jatrophae]SFS01500.1 Acyl-coenzyme A thioesterase PaaI, contains HGG motif [Sphingomonas jatrophae]
MSGAAATSPGWTIWALQQPDSFNSVLGPLQVRPEPPRGARVRIVPGSVHANLHGGFHGGAVMTLVDVALFATADVCGVPHVTHATTVDCSVQFMSAMSVHAPIECATEILRETGRLLFMRGLVTQEGVDTPCASFTATVRKGSPRT